jgi:flagellar protein FliT
MLNTAEVLSIYENVSEITDKMVAAARSGDWDTLVALENRCSGQVNRLKAEEPPEPLSAEVRETKVRIIKKILEDDRQIRDIVEPWMKQLAVLINSTGTERKLTQAYGAASR